MGFFTKKWNIPDIMQEFGLIGTNGNWDCVLAEYDIEWAVCDIAYANELVEQGIGEDRGYRVVNNIYYRLVYLPPPPHYQQYGP